MSATTSIMRDRIHHSSTAAAAVQQRYMIQQEQTQVAPSPKPTINTRTAVPLLTLVPIRSTLYLVVKLNINTIVPSFPLWNYWSMFCTPDSIRRSGDQLLL